MWFAEAAWPFLQFSRICKNTNAYRKTNANTNTKFASRDEPGMWFAEAAWPFLQFSRICKNTNAYTKTNANTNTKVTSREYGLLRLLGHSYWSVGTVQVQIQIH